MDYCRHMGWRFEIIDLRGPDTLAPANFEPPPDIADVIDVEKTPTPKRGEP